MKKLLKKREKKPIGDITPNQVIDSLFREFVQYREWEKKIL